MDQESRKPHPLFTIVLPRWISPKCCWPRPLARNTGRIRKPRSSDRIALTSPQSDRREQTITTISGPILCRSTRSACRSIRRKGVAVQKKQLKESQGDRIFMLTMTAHGMDLSRTSRLSRQRWWHQRRTIGMLTKPTATRQPRGSTRTLACQEGSKAEEEAAPTPPSPSTLQPTVQPHPRLKHQSPHPSLILLGPWRRGETSKLLPLR